MSRPLRLLGSGTSVVFKLADFSVGFPTNNGTKSVPMLEENLHAVDGVDANVSEFADLVGLEEFDSASSFVEIEVDGNAVVIVNQLSGVFAGGAPNDEVNRVGTHHHGLRCGNMDSIHNY